MEHVIIVAIVIAGICFFRYWKRLDEVEYTPIESEDNPAPVIEEDKTPTVEYEKVDKNITQMNIKDLVIDTLIKMGCKPEEEEDDDERIRFSYQDGSFFIDFYDDSYYIRVLFPFWHEFPANDLYRFARMQKVVNETNMRGYSVFYSINKDTNTVYLHSNVFLYFFPQIPYLDEYISSALRRLFQSRFIILTKIMEGEDL